MTELTLILGGARSGKSTFAEDLAARSGNTVTYIATAQALDDEMRARIAVHRQNRPSAWETREIPRKVGSALLEQPPKNGVILLDCITLLVSNIILQAAGSSEDDVDEAAAAAAVEQEIEMLLKAIHHIPARWILVSNEVGLGLVPPYPLGRIYRDLLGRVNQRLASQAAQVIFMIAGMPLRLSKWED